jgi:hypothetical protein
MFPIAGAVDAGQLGSPYNIAVGQPQGQPQVAPIAGTTPNVGGAIGAVAPHPASHPAHPQHQAWRRGLIR